MYILSNKTYNALKTQEKGYYSAKEVDAYIKTLATEMARQRQLPVMQGITRAAIRATYESNIVLYGIVNKIARAVGEVFPYLELTDKRSGAVVERHFINDLLAHPNDRFTTRMMGEAYAINYLIYGDAWHYCPKALGVNRGSASEMYIIPSQRVSVKAGDWDALFEGITIGRGSNGEIDAAQVFEVFDYNLDDTSFFGVSRVAIAALYLSVMDKAMRREDTSLDNGGVANLVAPARTEYAALKEDKDNAEQELNAKKNVNKNLFMRLPIEVHQLGNKPVDLDILNTHKEAVTALCFAFDIPVDLYYGQSKYENMREAKKAIYENNAIPLANKWGEALLNYLGLAGQFRLVVNTDNIDVLHSDPYDVAQKMSQVGAFTTNEIREAAGWDTIAESWADEVRLPMGVNIGYDVPDISEV